jgi:acetyltransferase
MPRHGNIAFISQSGALGVASLEYARENNIGLSKFFSVGNKADVTENNLLSFLRNDPQTDVILLYLEDLTDPKRFIELAREITDDPKKNKPILAIKSGRTQEGARAASSHTGALGSSDEAYNSLFAQCGVMRVETIEELFDYAMAFSTLPLPKGVRTGIVSNAGGFGILATDAAVRHGLELAVFEEKTTEALKKGLPPAANINNPIDIIGDAKEERYVLALENVLSDKNVDCAIVITTPPPMIPLKEITEAVSDVILKHNKPVVVCITGVTDISESVKILDGKNIPHYQFPEDAARSMACLAGYGKWLRRPRSKIKIFNNINQKRVKEIIAKARKEKRNFLPEPESHKILKEYGFPVLDAQLATNEMECLEAAEKIGYPVVLKIVSPDILHKVDVGGVKVNIKDEKQLLTAYRQILAKVKKTVPDAKIWGIFVQQMAGKGKETIIGMNHDPHFGPMLMFGMGGVYVEVLKDVTFRIAPIREMGALNMVKNIRGYKLLQGVRGEKPSDTDAIAECLMRLSQLATEMKDIVELDINPLMVYPEGKGAAVLDARILIK